MTPAIKFLSLFLLPLLVAACLPSPALPPTTADDNQSWRYADLRLLDGIDAPLPEQDVIAAYTRTRGGLFEIRLDFLDLKTEADVDLYIPIATGSPPAEAGKELPIHANAAFAWNMLLVIPADAEPAALTSQNKTASNIDVKVSSDPFLDSIVIQLNRQWAPTNPASLRFQVFAAAPGAMDASDQTAAFTIAGVDRPPRAPLLLAFWDTLPAATPAQALRRWDGAHTGPYGKRHGLVRLLQASEEAGIPVALLDLKTPSSLAALDYLGGMDYIRKLQSQGLVILPDVASGDPEAARASLEYSRRAALAFGLQTSRLLFGAVQPPLPGPYQAAFAVLPEQNHLLAAPSHRLIPLPAPVYPDTEEAKSNWQVLAADPNGLSLETRRELIQAALSGDPGQIAVIGGSLPSSPLADSSVASKFFHYLAAHPWIQPLTTADLLTFPAIQSSAPLPTTCDDLLCSPPPPQWLPAYSAQGAPGGQKDFLKWKEETRAQLASLPPGRLTDLAWLAYLNLTAPTRNPALWELRSAYLDHIQRLIAAVEWSRRPASESRCWQDANGGSCILSNVKQFIWIDLAEARLSLAVWRAETGPIQYIAPASQFALGLGDPTEWRPERGPAADPNEIPGAFANLPYRFDVYQAEAKAGEIALTQPNNDITKIYKLTTDGLAVHYISAGPIHTQIPLLIHSSRTNLPGTDGGFPLYLWLADAGRIDAPQVKIAGARDQINAYFDSRRWIRSPEDPDLDYPAGHYLPFPLAVIDVRSEGSYQVEFLFPSEMKKP